MITPEVKLERCYDVVSVMPYMLGMLDVEQKEKNAGSVIRKDILLDVAREQG